MNPFREISIVYKVLFFWKKNRYSRYKNSNRYEEISKKLNA